MKNCLAILLFVFSLSASAQYYSNRPGVDRRLMSPPASTSKKKAEKIDIIEIYVQKLDEKLEFDSFQKAVVQQLLKENKAKEDIIMAEDIPLESKYEKLIALREVVNAKVKEILTPEQIEKFQKLVTRKK